MNKHIFVFFVFGLTNYCAACQREDVRLGDIGERDTESLERADSAGKDFCGLRFYELTGPAIGRIERALMEADRAKTDRDFRSRQECLDALRGQRLRRVAGLQPAPFRRPRTAAEERAEEFYESEKCREFRYKEDQMQKVKERESAVVKAIQEAMQAGDFEAARAHVASVVNVKLASYYRQIIKISEDTVQRDSRKEM